MNIWCHHWIIPTNIYAIFKNIVCCFFFLFCFVDSKNVKSSLVEQSFKTDVRCLKARAWTSFAGGPVAHLIHVLTTRPAGPPRDPEIEYWWSGECSLNTWAASRKVALHCVFTDLISTFFRICCGRNCYYYPPSPPSPPPTDTPSS